MKFRMKLLALLLLISFLLLPWSSLFLSLPKLVQHNDQPMNQLADAPLDIDGNAQLAAAASSGNGSSEAPYIIQDKFIIEYGTDGIWIRNTTAHFILQNCTMTIEGEIHVDTGIMLNNVTNAQLENNTVNNGYCGIWVMDSHNIELTGNIVHDNFFGIALSSSYNNTMTNNTAYDNDFGITVSNSYNNTLNLNTAYNNTNYGIELYWSNNNTITSNTNYNSEYGILLFQSHNNTLTGNTNYNNEYGIYLSYSNYNTVNWNILTENSFCVKWFSSTGNIIENNGCREGIPGFTWALTLIGLAGLSLLGLALKRKENI